MNLRKKFVLVSAGGLTEKFIHRQNNKVLKRHMPKKKNVLLIPFGNQYINLYLSGRWNNQTKTDCCYKVKVAFTTNHMNGAYKLHKYIFGFYIMEPGLVNGRNHYTSVHGNGAFALGQSQVKYWVLSNLQSKKKYPDSLVKYFRFESIYKGFDLLHRRQISLQT